MQVPRALVKNFKKGELEWSLCAVACETVDNITYHRFLCIGVVFSLAFMKATW